MYITGEQFNNLKTVMKMCINNKDPQMNAVGKILNTLLDQIHHEPKVCALCKKDSNGTQK